MLADSTANGIFAQSVGGGGGTGGFTVAATGLAARYAPSVCSMASMASGNFISSINTVINVDRLSGGSNKTIQIGSVTFGGPIGTNFLSQGRIQYLLSTARGTSSCES